MIFGKKIGYITADELGNDNTLLEGPQPGMYYLIKNADFQDRATGKRVNIYPLVRTEVEGQVPAYEAVLTEQDYTSVATLPSDLWLTVFGRLPNDAKN